MAVHRHRHTEDTDTVHRHRHRQTDTHTAHHSVLLHVIKNWQPLVFGP